jgi:SAM-dependent methyltransferase
LYRVRKRVFRRNVGRLPVDFSQANVLDIGSGVGFYIERWKELGVKHITGADITQVVVQRLSHKYPDSKFVQVDIGGDDAALEGYTFDIISTFDVLFHIVDDARFARAIQNIAARLKPGGLFIFSDNFLHGEPVRVPIQVSRALTDIEQLLRENNLEVVERRPMFVLMANPIDSNNTFLKLFWRLVAGLAARSEALGFMIGAILYPVELLCTALLRESPTTEMMICRKIK